MSLRKRAAEAYAAMRPDPGTAEHPADGSAVRDRVRRWCQRMGVTGTPVDIVLEKQSLTGSGGTAGWFRFTVEDIEFLARADSEGRFDVFLADATPDDEPIRDLADLGRNLALRNSDTTN